MLAYDRMLEASEANPQPAAEQPDSLNFNGLVVDANMVQTSPDGRVGLYVESPQFTATPGQPTSTAMVLVNLGSELDHFSLTLGGLPSK